MVQGISKVVQSHVNKHWDGNLPSPRDEIVDREADSLDNAEC